MASEDAPPEREDGRASQATGLPWLRTWRGVYWFVMGCFFAWVLMLFLLGEVFR